MSDYVKLPRERPPVIPEEDKNPLQLAVERKEKVTSNTAILLDGTGSDWTDLEEGPSLASTATAVSIRRSEGNSLKQVLTLGTVQESAITRRDNSNNQDVNIDNVNGQVVIPLVERERSESDSEEFSLPADTIAREDHIEDMLNQAILDTTLEEIQSLSRKRPKGLLLGK